MSSSSSSSSSSSNGNGGGGVGYGVGRGGDYEGPSRSRPRAAINGVWPEPFLEALAFQVALDASRLAGRLAAAQALANLFQVCSTWRAVSRSDPLWARLTRVIWARTRLLHNTWQEEYIFRHRTAQNFRAGVADHYAFHFDPSDVADPNDPDALTCRRLALSDRHLACGFADGSVRLLDLHTRNHTATFYPQQRNRLGRFSRAVSGIVFGPPSRLVFATLDGDIHVAAIDDDSRQLRMAHTGNTLEDGVLIDFAGCSRWWVGLFAGVPGRAFHIWDANSEERTFVGGSLTDPEALVGWHTLIELTEFVGRVRVIASRGSAVASTRSRFMAFDLRDQGVILGEEEYNRETMVGCFDVSREAYVSVDVRGMATVRRVDNFGEVCRFGSRGPRGLGVVGCMNDGYALMCAGGVVRVFWVEGVGEFLYALGERVGEVNALVADERHAAAAGVDTSIHLWDFGGQ